MDFRHFIGEKVDDEEEALKLLNRVDGSCRRINSENLKLWDE